MLITGVLLVLNSTLSSSLPGGATKAFSRAFQVDNDLQLVLPNSVYLIGYVFGPIMFGPLSEIYGRKPVLLGTFTAYMLFTLGCALAPSWEALLIFRSLAGIFASSPLSIVGGLCADVFNDPVQRGRAIAVVVGVLSPSLYVVIIL